LRNVGRKRPLKPFENAVWPFYEPSKVEVNIMGQWG
jgi:hypothetical protein